MRTIAVLLIALLPYTRTSAQTRLTTEQVGGFNRSVYATASPGDPARIFVVELAGVIRVIDDGVIIRTPFLDISSRVQMTGEGGLLGLAFHPDYQRNGRFYVYYTRTGDGATMLARYQVTSNPNVADPQSGRVLLGPVAQTDSTHNGGCLQFGPDGYLYVGLGDGGGTGDPTCAAQNGQSLLGKILRLDVDSPSRVPPTNPFVGDPTHRDEIWAKGFRNPWRFSFDRETGDLWIGDVGQENREEIDFQPASSQGGTNYGWKMMEGTQCYSSAACPSGTPPCNAPSLTLPIHEYDHQVGCAVIGGYVYRGCAIPDLRGTYFYADLCTHRIWSFRYDGTSVSQLIDRTAELSPSGSSILRIVSFGEDPEGELMIVTQFAGIWRIVPRGAEPGRDLGFGTRGANGVIPQFEVCGRLTPSATAELHLDSAAPAAPAALLVAMASNPTPIPPFGTVVPYPVMFAVGATTDAAGEIALQIRGGGAPAVAYAQWVVLDAAGPGGVALSNVLEITFP